MKPDRADKPPRAAVSIDPGATETAEASRLRQNQETPLFGDDADKKGATFNRMDSLNERTKSGTIARHMNIS